MIDHLISKFTSLSTYSKPWEERSKEKEWERGEGRRELPL